MAVHVGRPRECPVLDWKFVVVGHNTIRGAAGAAILNAELIVARALSSGGQAAFARKTESAMAWHLKTRS
jgi:hypothetical protein